MDPVTGKFPFEKFKKKLFECDELLTNTITNEESIPGATKWLNKNHDSSLESFIVPTLNNKRILRGSYMYVNKIDCSEVYPNIFVGNQISAENIQFLKDIGITHVLNCCSSSSENLHCYMKANIKFKGFDLEDAFNENISRYFDDGIEFIDDCLTKNPPGKILIHCFAGISRSATFSIAYLMKKLNFSLNDAIVQIKKNRNVHPNEGFLKQLVILDLELHG